MAELHCLSLGCTHIWATHGSDFAAHTLRSWEATLLRASLGHSLNQSMVQQLTREGNLRSRALQGLGPYLGSSTASIDANSNARAGLTCGQDNSGSAVAEATGSRCALQRSGFCVMHATCQCTVCVLDDVINTALTLLAVSDALTGKHLPQATWPGPCAGWNGTAPQSRRTPQGE